MRCEGLADLVLQYKLYPAVDVPTKEKRSQMGGLSFKVPARSPKFASVTSILDY